MMHIVITDSGVGGLSVVAWAESFARSRGLPEPVTLTFANAAPANDYGYNSMKSREEKIETFDRFLHSVSQRLAPDLIYVACNTLSVLLPDTRFFAKSTTPAKGIVRTSVDLLLRELASDRRSAAIIFGTVTTIEAGTYPRLLEERGVDRSRIVSQACPGLADTISEDEEGTTTAAAIGRWVDEAIGKVGDRGVPAVALLACTHYGYRREMFERAFAERGIEAKVVNPNEHAVDDLFASGGGPVRDAAVRFITRYPIPQATQENLARFLRDISPKTVEAMREFALVPDLF